MIENINPRVLDVTGSVQTVTITKTAGQTSESWATTYTIRFKWLEALRSQAREDVEGMKPVAKQKRAMLLRKEARAITTQMRVLVGSEYWYIEAVRPYKGSRNLLVLDVWQNDK